MRSSALLFALLPAFAGADVTVERIVYHGWQDSCRFSNGTVELIVVPKIGRVLRYGYIGKPNILYENLELSGKPQLKAGWTNYGGDKMWPAPQSAWNWPPDPQIDGSEWKAEVTKTGVIMTSPDSSKSRIRFVREIRMAAFGTRVDFHNRMDNLGKRRTIGPWQITQTDNPSLVVLPFEPTGQSPKGWRLLAGSKLDPKAHEVKVDGLAIQQSNIDYKFGAFSRRGEITSQRGSTIFHVSTKVYPKVPYSDGGSPLQVYTSAHDKVVELELLGPLAPLENGEGAILDVSWQLSQAR